MRFGLAFPVFALALVFGAPEAARAYTIKQTSSGARIRWHETEVPLQIVYVGARTVPRAEVEAALHRAAREWSGVPGAPRLRVRGPEAELRTWGADGINGVYVLEHWPFPDRRLAVTVSTLIEGTGELVDTDVLVNGEMRFDLFTEDHRPVDRYDLGLVLTHELGHVLGLDESERHEATMWPDIRAGEMERRALAADDVGGVMDLYEVTGLPPSPPGTHGTTTSLGCAVARGEPEASPGGSAPEGAPVVLGLAWLLARRVRRRSVDGRSRRARRSGRPGGATPGLRP